MCLLIAPFHVYADTISSSNIVGVNVSVVDYEVVGDNVFNSDYPKSSFILKFELVLDKEYLGYLTGKFTCSIFGHDSQGQSLQISVDSGNKSFYVCGQTLTYYVEQKLYFSNTPTSTYVNIYTPSFTLAGSNVVEFGLLESLEDIQRAIEMMDFHTEQITQYLYDSTNGSILEQVVTTNQLLVDAGQMFYNVMLTTDNINNYVIDMYEFMIQSKQYNIPFESIVYNTYLMENHRDYLYGYYPYLSYPIYRFTNVKYVFQLYTDKDVEYDWIFVTDCSQPALLRNYMNISNANATVTFKYTSNLGQVSNYGYMYIYHCIVKSTSNASTLITIDFSQTSPNLFMGVIINRADYHYYGTDFALQFGLTNPLLDNIDKIANGTVQSNDSSDDLQDSKDDMQSQFNDMFGYEDDFNNDMNTALQNINVNFDVGNQLGSKFLASADWVRQQYNTLTSNTPFGTVLSFSLLLGLALLIIGKAVR